MLILYCSILLASLAISSASSEIVYADVANDGNWPRPSDIRLFVPYDSQTRMDDIVYNRKPEAAFWPTLRTDIAGPFREPSSSYGVASSPSYIGRYDKAITTPSFTIAFYYYYTKTQVADERYNAIVMIDGPPLFSVGYYDGNDGLEITSYGATVAKIPKILSPGWNFVAIVYNDQANKLAIYNAAGAVVYTGDVTIKPPPFFWATRLVTGLHFRGRGYTNLRQDDAIACIFAYNAALDGGDIAALPAVCQTKGKGTRPTVAPTTPTTTKPKPGTAVWPLPTKLLGFWPLTLSHRLGDVGPNRFKATGRIDGILPMAGPFGDDHTALKSPNQISDSNGLMFVADTKLALSAGKAAAFTVSLFFSIGSSFSTTSGGGLFEFIDQGGSNRAFQFRYKEDKKTLEVSANGATIAELTLILPDAAWTFAAFVFDGQNLTVYSRHGVFLPPTAQSELSQSMAYNNGGIRLGYASRWSEPMSTADGLACLMVYSTALSAAQVRQAYSACRVVQGTAPCGTPRLPLSPIPSSTATTTATIPKMGQFPWVASLRFNNDKGHVCSASIVDAYWLITAALCFQKSADPAMYSVYVAEHDLNASDPYTEKHGVAKIITNGDIALLHVDSPIDFRSQYVQDVCLHTSADRSDLAASSSSPQFVVGWGKNGRPSFVSQGLPRYVAGKTLSEAECQSAWSDAASSSGRHQDLVCFSSNKNVPCSGDEGSGLLVPTLADNDMGVGEHLAQIGIYYKRDATCSNAKPGLFVDLRPYNNWIAEQLACAVPGVSYPSSCPQ